MELTLLVFGIIKQKTGKSSLKIDMKGTPTVKNLREEFIKQYPDFQQLNIMVAVNNNYVTSDIELNDDDEIALIPPISGG